LSIVSYDTDDLVGSSLNFIPMLLHLLVTYQQTAFKAHKS